MAIGKIEPTGCAVRKGKVQLRFSFYLEPGDSRYEEHHVYVVDETSPEYLRGFPDYTGELDPADGSPIDEEAHTKWVQERQVWEDALPHIWRDNPFHNHFIYVDANTTDDQVKQLLEESLKEFFGIWARGKNILEAWRTEPLKSKRRFVAGDMSARNIKRCNQRVGNIIGRVAEFQAVRRSM